MGSPQIDIEEALAARLRYLTGYRKPISAKTELYNDVGLRGDDAWELLEWVHETYGTSFKGMTAADYFTNEHSINWGPLLRRFGWRGQTMKSLTIGHFVAVIEQGQWFEPPS
jgi:hypothetical protein